MITQIKKIKIIFFIFIALFIFLLWLNVLHAPFVFDDAGNIREIYAIQINSLSFNSLKNVITNTYAKNRPLANLTFAFNWYFGKDNTLGYHLVNLIIHWLSSVFLFLFLQELFFLEKAKVGLEEKHIKYLPYIITLLWLSSPLQIQSVTYIVQRMTSMAGMFFFLSLFFYAKGRRTHKSYLYLLSALSWTLSLLCKEITIILPFILILYEWIFIPDTQKLDKKKAITYILISLTLIFLSIILYSLLSGKNIFTGIFLADFSERGYTMTQRVMTQWRVLIFYISLLLLPLPSRLNIDHHIIASTGLFNPLTTILSLITILTLLYIAYRIRTRHPLLSFGIFWYFLTLVIESSILNLELIFEHRLYIPSLGFWLVAVYLIMHISQTIMARSETTCLRATHRQAKQSHHTKDIILIPIFILILTAQSYGTIIRNQVWQSDLNLWEDAVQKSPNKARPHNNLGNAYTKRERYDDAIVEFKKALNIEPDLAEAHNNLGFTYNEKGWYDQAIAEYKKALQIKPNYAEAFYNLGVAYDKKGWHEEAISEYQKALEVKPDYAKAYYNLGTVYDRKGLYEQAIVKYKQALEIEPDDAEAHNNLGVIYSKKGWFERAIIEYQKALQIKPDYTEAYNNLGIAYENNGLYDQAVAEYEKALQTKPDYAEAYYNLGNAYKKMGLNDQAVMEYKKALKIKPDYVEVYNNLGVIYFDMGLYDQAIAEYEKALQIKPDHLKTHYNLVLIYEQKKQKDKAVYHLKECLKYETDEKRKMEEIDMLQQLISY